MNGNRSIEFFDRQFARQVRDGEAALNPFALNPFEQAALPHLHGRLLDYGCGLGQLSLAAARAGCSVLALDGSTTAVSHLQQAAASLGLPIDARVVDLREHRLAEMFDSIACIGLLMFFACPAAERALAELENHLRPGGTLALNVLVQGTTYMDMFDPAGHCLFERDALSRRYARWQVISDTLSEFAAPGGLNKAFATVIARKPRG